MTEKKFIRIEDLLNFVPWEENKNLCEFSIMCEWYYNGLTRYEIDDRCYYPDFFQCPAYHSYEWETKSRRSQNEEYNLFEMPQGQDDEV